MSFVKQLHHKLTELKEEGASREELETIFDDVVKGIFESNNDLFSNVQNKSKKGEHVRNNMFEDVYSEIRLRQIAEEV